MGTIKKQNQAKNIQDSSMKWTTGQPGIKLKNSSDVYKFVVQNVDSVEMSGRECFIAIYLNCSNETIDFKNIIKGTTNSISDITRQIFNIDQKLEVSSMIVCHSYQIFKRNYLLNYSEFDIDLVNALIDASFFSGIWMLDFQIMNKLYAESMLKNSTVDFNKHKCFQRITIKQNEYYNRSTDTQELFDMDISELKNLVFWEHNKITDADSFVGLQIIDLDYQKYKDIRFNSVHTYDFDKNLTKVFLVRIFKEYMIIKERLLKFINESNLYPMYLSSMFDYLQYSNFKKAEEERTKETEKKITKENKQRVNCSNQLRIVVKNRMVTSNRSNVNSLTLLR